MAPGNLIKRVNRLTGVDEFEPTPDGLRRRPSYPKFDRRNGALIQPGVRPFIEFEQDNHEGEEVPGVEVLEAEVSRKDAQTSVGSNDNVLSMPADRESLRSLRHKSLAEKIEAESCFMAAEVLREDQDGFDELVIIVMNELRIVADRTGLDQDERQVLAMKRLLGTVGARTYLNYVDGANNKRLRNAFDRLDRKLKKPEWAAILRRTLHEEARKERTRREEQWWKWYSEGCEPRPEPPPRPKWDSSRGAGIPAEETLRHHTEMDRTQGLLFSPSNEPGAKLDGEDGAGTVDLGCDLTPKQRALYRSSARKPKPSRKTEPYSE